MCAKIATRVVDGYVIQRENVDAIFNNLLAAETAAEEEARRQTDNDKTFASKGKQMRDAMRGAMQSPWTVGWTVGFISAWLYSYYKPSNIQSLVKKTMFYKLGKRKRAIEGGGGRRA